MIVSPVCCCCFGYSLVALGMALASRQELSPPTSRSGSFSYSERIGGAAIADDPGEVADHEIGLRIRTTILAAGAYYRIYDQLLGGETVFGDTRQFTIEPTVGLRWTKLQAKADAGFIGLDKSADWLDPFIGVRLSTDLTDRWNLSGEADIGGFDTGSKLAINAQAYLGYRTEMFNHPTMLRVGYRYLSQDFETGDFSGNRFKWDVTQQRPVIGLSMRF
ncbi:hypothetical protein [Pararhizobium qamdonense]|uniref:hypothetical protein n=1 Tax=Pararhizobium qamdonense TaxID=3031126 RepID=UPI0023E28179|nr:hypothetical protein [Pararhizobium qamdonense]